MAVHVDNRVLGYALYVPGFCQRDQLGQRGRTSTQIEVIESGFEFGDL
jgi:hypothetical protein